MSIQQLLLSLPFVVTRRLNGRDGYFTAGRMFALVGDASLMLRLPVPASAALVETDRAVPLVDAAIPSPLTWVTVPADRLEPAELHDLALKAHQAVRAARRRARRDGTPPRRRRRSVV
ncbi:MAG: hypothetical protein AB7L66_10045 [Gemmatimonadales bacterium]